MSIKCCKDCTLRSVGCHGTCDHYKKERNTLDEKNKFIKAERASMGAQIRTLVLAQWARR